MKSIFHPADSRGHNNFSWLNSYHSFSFGNYYHPDKIHFGALRVLNDDVVTPGNGFGAHPHENMEIISIPLEGVLEHEDNVGNKGIIEYGDVQIMSAGTGIQHSEYNHSRQLPVKFLQIWIFPHTKSLNPSYDQKTFDIKERLDKWQILADPKGETGVKINQNSWLAVSKLNADRPLQYDLKDKRNGVYVFLLSGSIHIGNQVLAARDASGIWDIESIAIEASELSEVLVIEVPMEF